MAIPLAIKNSNSKYYVGKTKKDEKRGRKKKNEKDIIGKKFGRLTAIKEYGKCYHNKKLIYCKCECGTKKAIRESDLITGNTKSCGCLTREKKENAGNTKPIPIGQKFNSWTVLGKRDNKYSGHGNWLCQCNCGTVMNKRSNEIKTGDRKQCKNCFKK